MQYTSRILRYYLNNLKSLKKNENFKVELLTPEINSGLWASSLPSINMSFDFTNNINQYFELNKANMIQFLNKNLITQNFKEGDEQLLYLDEIFICLVGIFMIKKDSYSVELSISKGIEICNKLNMKNTKTKLNLMRLSFEMKV